jgi:hypothetical protein
MFTYLLQYVDAMVIPRKIRKLFYAPSQMSVILLKMGEILNIVVQYVKLYVLSIMYGYDWKHQKINR